MPDFIKSPYQFDTVESKSSSLEDAKQRKLDRLGSAEYETVPLESLYDVDSAGFAGVTGGLGSKHDSSGNLYDKTGKRSIDRIDGIDSYEMYPSSTDTLDYQTNNPDGIRKMAKQRARLAESRGVDFDSVTNEDVYEQGAKDTLKTLAIAEAYSSGRDKDYIQQVIDWEPSSDVTKQWRTSSPSFGSKENLKDLNIQVERAFLGEYGAYGRPLTSVRPLGSEHLWGEEGTDYKYFEEDWRKEVPVSADSLEENYLRAQADNASVGDRIGNTFAGFASSFTDSLIISPLDAIGDLTGLYDIGSGDENTKAVNEFFGYNPIQAERAMENIRKQWEIASDDKTSKTQAAKAIGNGIIEAFITPEMWGTSMGALMSWVTPGAILKAAGVGSKFANSVKAIDAAADAGKITKSAARAQKAKAFMSIDGSKAALTSQSGYLASALGNVNKQYEEFVENNNGVELKGAEKAEWFGTRFAVQMVNQNLDKIVDFQVMKAPGVIAGLIPAVKGMTNKEFSKAAKAMGTGVGVTAAAMGAEAAQEYTQTMMEVFNSRYGSEKFSDVNTFAEFITDERNTTEAAIAAIAGAGGAPQFEAVGTLGSATVKAAPLGSSAVNAIKGAFKKPENVEQTNQQQAEEDLRSTLSQVASSSSSDDITDNELAQYVATSNSTSEEDRKAASSQAANISESIVKGTHSVFNSDSDFSTVKKKLDDAITIVSAENPGMADEEFVQAVIKHQKNINDEQKAELESVVRNAATVGRELNALKTMADVSTEVKDGPKGYATYASVALAAKSKGDSKTYKEAEEKLDYFYSYAKEKLERIRNGVSRVTDSINKDVDKVINRGEAKTREEALEVLSTKSKYKGKSSLTVNNSDYNDFTTEVYFKDVLSGMRFSDYNRGTVRLVNNVTAEVEAMSKLHKRFMPSTSNTPEPASGAESAPNDQGTTSGDVKPYFDADALDNVSNQEGTEPAIIDDGIGSVEPYFDAGNVTTEENNGYFIPDSEIPDTNTTDGTFFDEEAVTTTSSGAFLPDDAETDFEQESVDVDGSTTDSGTVEKNSKVRSFSEANAKVKDVQKRISERRGELRSKGVTTLKEALNDTALKEMYEEKTDLESSLKEGFGNVLGDIVSDRLSNIQKGRSTDFRIPTYTRYTTDGVVEKSDSEGSIKFKTLYDGRKVAEYKRSASKLFGSMKPTGFTIDARTEADVKPITRRFADRLKALHPQLSPELGTTVENDPLSLFLFDGKGNINYNAVEAVQAGAYEYITMEASDLLGSSRDFQDIADVLDITIDEVTPQMVAILGNGGITRKLAASAIGNNVLKNLGVDIKESADREAIAVAFGHTALRALEGDFIKKEVIKAEGPLRGDVTIIKGLPSFYNSNGVVDNNGVALPTVKDADTQLKVFEAELGVDMDKSRTYRKQRTASNRKVQQHRAEFQDAPKDQTEVVNRLENTAFRVNRGHRVMLEAYSKTTDTGRILDEGALIERILGPESGITNKDGMDRYSAQKAAVSKAIKSYRDAVNDVGTDPVYFSWFIAKQLRIHLDSTGLNPQEDKQLARWLFTTETSRTSINKRDIDKALEGEESTMQAKTFLYGIVQAFDGIDGVAGIDKNNDKEVIASANKLLNSSDADLLSMMKDRSLAHVGHAALAIANIREYKDSVGTVNSDMVLEIDGLTNGFAFRMMQFPRGEDSQFWLDRVGTITEDSEYYGLNSMNEARSTLDKDGKGQEDVYISVGKVYQEKVVARLSKMKKGSVGKNWVDLLVKHKALPDFREDVTSKVRNLMKSPVMIFNYAAGINRIASSLVEDQLMGTGYLSGRGVVDFLTSKKGGEYVVSEKELVSVFGEVKGGKYHRARVELISKSMKDMKDPNIATLENDVRSSLDLLYADPLKETLEELFADSVEVNKAMVDAAKFMFNHFKKRYDDWKIANPDATEANKKEFMKNEALILPGIAAASSDDVSNKVTFLHSVLEPTDAEVRTTVLGETVSSAPITRTFGDPGVRAAVLMILASDSSVLSQTINQYYKGTKGGSLPIHDAMVMGADESGLINEYNESFYTTNKDYSILDEFVKAVNALEQQAPEVAYESVYDPAAKKSITFYDMKEHLSKLNYEVQTNRSELFSKDVKVGQFVGPPGTMAEFSPKAKKEEVRKHIQSKAKTILKDFNSPQVKRALGVKTFNKALKDIKKMLEGCK